MKQPFTTKYPTICELQPLSMRHEFFRRVCDKFFPLPHTPSWIAYWDKFRRAQ